MQISDTKDFSRNRRIIHVINNCEGPRTIQYNINFFVLALFLFIY